MSFPEREDDQTCSSFLRKIALTDDRRKRLKVLKAYARMKTLLSEKILLEALGDPCEEIRDFIVRELAGRENLQMNQAYARLAGPPWYARSAVLRIIAIRRSGDALRHIERVLDDANADVRKCAAEALGELGGSEALRLLVRLKKDSNPYVRAAAEAAMRKASDVRFV